MLDKKVMTKKEVFIQLIDLFSKEKDQLQKSLGDNINQVCIYDITQTPNVNNARRWKALEKAKKDVWRICVNASCLEYLKSVRDLIKE